MSTHTPGPEQDHAHYSIDGETCDTCGQIVYQRPTTPPLTESTHENR